MPVALQPPTSSDLKLVEEQLGRLPRAVLAIGARCNCGAPTVVLTAPRLEDGTPFPTFYYLTHPEAVKAVSKLEAANVMDYFNSQLQADVQLQIQYEKAHRNYLRERETIAQVPEISDISAGGMPKRVKCLHALVAHSLVVGPGINPIGDRALEMIANQWSPKTCTCGGKKTQRLAAIDCGTNTISLLVADVPGSEGKPLDDVVRRYEVVRLGQGVDKTGSLDAQALERTLIEVEKMAQEIRHLGAQKVRFVATSATRDASNQADFVSGVQRAIGIVPEIISGKEEAQLSFQGAVGVLGSQVKSPALVVDIGGGSTELALGNALSGKLEQSFSMNIGSVRIWERYLSPYERAREENSPNWQEELRCAQERLRKDVDKALDEAERYVDLRAVRSLVGVAGTVTSITALYIGLECYQPELIHGKSVAVSEIVKTCRKMADATWAERREFGFLSPGRVEVIGAGAIIWERILRRVASTSALLETDVLTSEHNLLDGIALSLI